MLRNPVPNLRLRFAPSPTGYLHLGGLRTCLYNYLLAKKLNGKLIFRLEDTDRSRLVHGSLLGLKEAFQWTGIKFDEGVDEGGKYGPYVQSLRLNLYQEKVDQLIKQAKAYRCFCSKERLEKVKQTNLKLGRTSSSYDKRCRSLTPSQTQQNLQQNLPYVVRFKNDAMQDFDYDDLLYGKVQLNSTLDDFILLKSDKYPTYHFANVVDDHYMGINLVLRGEEWLNSTYKHLLLYQALGFEPPKFLHLPLLLNPDGTKLSKRFNDVNVLNYQRKGYVPEALINFVGLLGFTPKHNLEFLTMEQLVEQFDLRLLNKSTPKVHLEKLNHFNKLHLNHLWQNQKRRDQLVQEKMELFQANYNDSVEMDLLNTTYLTKVLSCMKDRVQLNQELLEATNYFFHPLPTLKSTSPAALERLKLFHTNLEHLEFISSQSTHLKSFPEETWPQLLLDTIVNHKERPNGLTKNKVLANFRLLVTDTKLGPGILEVMKVLGKDRVFNRLNRIEFGANT